MDRLLVTTAIEQTWGQGEPVLFLGEWCKLYSRRAVWSKLDAEVLTHHWNDRQKLRHDYEVLKSLYERILRAMREKLNQIHGVDKSLRYWRIILGPWLITYLPILFDRWEVLRCAFQKQETYKTYLISSDRSEGARIPQDFNEFCKFFVESDTLQSDEWNYHIFLRILKFQYEQNAEYLTVGPIVEEKYHSINHMPDVRRISGFKEKLVLRLDKALSYLSELNSEVFFYQSYIRPTQLCLLNLALHQAPNLHMDTFSKEIRSNPNKELRDNNIVSIEAKSNFERFVAVSLMQDIPISYLEAYRDLAREAEQIGFNPKVIVTANGYWGNDLFKIWAAEKVAGGVKLVIVEHGGSLPPLFCYFDHHHDVGDYSVTWFSTSHPKQVQLPPSKLFGFRIDSSRKYCSVIGLEMPRYSYRASAGPIGAQILQCFEHTLVFCNSLKHEVFGKLKVKPYPSSGGWETAVRYIDRLGKDKVYDECNYYKVLGHSKLIVCTYPETTFSEAMASGLPTILVYKAEFFERAPEADHLVDVLTKANIIFDDPIKAAKHVNAIWDKVEDWWAEPEVVQARELFYRTACNFKGSPLKEWVKFLRALLDPRRST